MVVENCFVKYASTIGQPKVMKQSALIVAPAIILVLSTVKHLSECIIT